MFLTVCCTADVHKKLLAKQISPRDIIQHMVLFFSQLIITIHTFMRQCLMLGELTIVENTMTFMTIALKLQDLVNDTLAVYLFTNLDSFDNNAIKGLLW